MNVKSKSGTPYAAERYEGSRVLIIEKLGHESIKACASRFRIKAE